MSLSLRRFLLIVLSLVFGIATLFGIFGLLNTAYNAGLDLQEYGVVYSIFTVLPMAIFAAIWLDYFLSTGLLPEGPEEEDS
jgi:hypothetical protein